MCDMKSLSTFSLCHIEDCGHYSEGVCNKGYNPGSLECESINTVSRKIIIPQGIVQFSSKDFEEISLSTASKGSQIKWLAKDGSVFIKELFHYQERNWNDHVVEYIASEISKQLQFNCVEQNIGSIDGRACSYSMYWGKSKKFISFDKLDKDSLLLECKTAQEKIDYVLKIVNEKTGLDYSEYLMQMCIMDYIIGNEDRHENNFGVWYDGNRYEIAPLFDFGLGLFEHDIDYFGRTLEEAKRRMQHKPFGKWDQVLNYLAGKVNFPKCKVVIPEIMPNELAKAYLEETLSSLGLR